MVNDSPAASGSEATVQANDASRYFETRFQPDPRRDQVWRHIVDYLRPWWSDAGSVMDLGAGYCSFINAVDSPRRVAVDLSPATRDAAADGVEVVTLSALEITSRFEAAEFDVVFSSNLLEHLERTQIAELLRAVHRVLRPRGRLILMGPNYRLSARRYWDDYTHLTALSDVSLTDFVESEGFRVTRAEPRFIPFSLRSRLSALSALTPVYLKLPFRPFAGQMLIVAERADA